MRVREFRSQLRESLDKFVDAAEADGDPDMSGADWFGNFQRFLTESRDGEAEPASFVDILGLGADLLDASDDDDDEG